MREGYEGSPWSVVSVPREIPRVASRLASFALGPNGAKHLPW